MEPLSASPGDQDKTAPRPRPSPGRMKCITQSSLPGRQKRDSFPLASRRLIVCHSLSAVLLNGPQAGLSGSTDVNYSGLFLISCVSYSFLSLTESLSWCGLWGHTPRAFQKLGLRPLPHWSPLPWTPAALFNQAQWGQPPWGPLQWMLRQYIMLEGSLPMRTPGTTAWACEVVQPEIKLPPGLDSD